MTTCPYCKDAVPEMEAVYCPSCEAVHHAECWEGNGEMCSVYGCKSKAPESLLGCPRCEEVYINERKTCMICNLPLMTPEECLRFVENHNWVRFPLLDTFNPMLAAGYLRNNGIMARISKKAPISMFQIGFKSTLWVTQEQSETASALMTQLADRIVHCPECGHVLFRNEECSYCSESSGDLA